MKTIEKLSAGNGVVALVELNNDSVLTEASLEVLTAAKSLDANTKVLVLAGTLSDSAKQQISQSGLSSVTCVDATGLTNYQVENYTEAVSQVLKKLSPKMLIAPASTSTRDYLPRVAARHQAGYTPDCLTLDSLSEYTRPLYSGKVLCRVSGNTDVVQIVLLRPKAFRKTTSESASVSVETLAVDLSAVKARTTLVSTEAKDTSGKIVLEEADMIVSGGRGLKGPENFHLVEDLAKKLNAGVGATRAVVDAGWRPHSEQVGQTGKSVSPQLYIAVGIHGAIQHLVGMNTSQNIIAINTNPDAPIFEIADLSIVGDAFEVIPALLAKL